MVNAPALGGVQRATFLGLLVAFSFCLWATLSSRARHNDPPRNSVRQFEVESDQSSVELSQLTREFELLSQQAAEPSLGESVNISDRATDLQDDAAYKENAKNSEKGADRTYFNLALYFVHQMGTLDADQLFRHQELNSATQSGHIGAKVEFEQLITRINTRLNRLAEHWRLTRTREMVSRIDAGAVAPVKTTTPSQAELSWIADSLMMSPEVQAAGHTRDEILAGLMHSPPPNAGVASNHIVHGGRVYLMSSFDALPVSDGMFDTIKFFAWESLVAVYAWCLANNLGPSPHAIERALQTITALTAYDVRSR